MIKTFFSGTSAFMCYQIPKLFLQRNSSDTIRPIPVVGIRGFIPFLRVLVRKGTQNRNWSSNSITAEALVQHFTIILVISKYIYQDISLITYQRNPLVMLVGHRML